MGDDVSPGEKRSRLTKARDKICYHRRRNAEARHFHTKKRKAVLHALGIDLRSVRRCPLVI